MLMTLGMANAVIAGADRAAAPLTVLYDERCPLCRKLRAWLATQPTTISIAFLAAGSPEARRRFPFLDHERSMVVLTVVDPGGAVYEAERAWLACAWAIPRWQPVAERLNGRLRLKVVSAFAGGVDRYRHHAMGRSCDGCTVAAPRGTGLHRGR